MAPLRKKTAPAHGGQVPKIIDATTSNDTSTGNVPQDSFASTISLIKVIAEPTDIVSLPDNGGTFIAYVLNRIESRICC
jgi:hypothetical protein